MTPSPLCHKLLAHVDLNTDGIFVEPSFGEGAFIHALSKNGVSTDRIFGCELDEVLYKKSGFSEPNFINKNFYDYSIDTKGKKVIFVGNPPFRSPAISLRTHRDEIKRLCKKYAVFGIREEAVFFILKTVELIEKNGNNGEMHYVLPHMLLTNNSKFFVKFQDFLKQKFEIINKEPVEKGTFVGADLDMVLLSLRYNNQTSKINKVEEDYWPYTKMFIRTYLGSVPCESIFLSCKGETKDEFRTRLEKLYQGTREELDANLRHRNGLAHLKVLNDDNQELKDRKLEVIWSYLENVRNKRKDFLQEIQNIDNYKPIQHRKEVRFYLRTPLLKNCGFVYEINPKPCKSFYFTGNPSKSSTDYFGYCEYDITRNSSPGACRTIPEDGVENNFAPEFKQWWDTNIKLPYSDIFDKMIQTSQSPWYKDMKKRYNRFYFGIQK